MTKEMTMVERVAQFLKVRDDNLMPHEADDEERRESALATLAAMRQPTKSMLAATEDIVVYYDDFAIGDGTIYLSYPNYHDKAERAWQKMIDAAIKESK